MESIPDHLDLDYYQQGHLSPHHFHQPQDSDPTQTGTPPGKDVKKQRITYKEIDQNNKRRGHWGNDQKRLYHLFLEIYHKHFENRQMRRLDKIFKVMSQFIGSRAADQCRSHHQKMQKKYKNFHSILSSMRDEYYSSQSIEGPPFDQNVGNFDNQTPRQIKYEEPQAHKYFESFDEHLNYLSHE